ncbi:single-stranded DNA-binding protein [Pseudomonas taiwanensis]|uniref:single-stranded DNA-binding protein n=1 Tax=Pseudomonas taiwanensis TaxID=470150 RepID=UPI0028DE277D|nr:single-stranded DNA-binding protein [Pseudomonas taiwanensis]MDT8925043.1 single-stranded DNA-binding protein [Pseudomonas taiwanensis]
MKKHIVVGNLVSAVSISSQNGRDTAAMTVAVNEFKKADGTQVTSYHSIVATGKSGFLDNVKEYLTKGKGVTVVGTPFLSEREKDGHVYRNAGIRLTRLGDLRFTGQDIAAAPVAGSAQEQKSDAQIAAEQQAAELAQSLQQQASPQPAGNAPATDFDGHDDDIPF